MIYRICQAYHALPSAGGVLDQSVELLKMHAILEAGGYFEEKGAPAPAPPDPFAGLPTVTL